MGDRRVEKSSINRKEMGEGFVTILAIQRGGNSPPPLLDAL